MKTDPRQRPESEAPHDLVSRLGAAILRINASLEPDTVLGEVLGSARALSGARYGLITTLDTSGQPQDFVSSGFTPEEHRQMAAWPDGPRLDPEPRGPGLSDPSGRRWTGRESWSTPGGGRGKGR